MATTQPIYDHFTNPVDMVEHIATIHDLDLRTHRS